MKLLQQLKRQATLMLMQLDKIQTSRSFFRPVKWYVEYPDGELSHNMPYQGAEFIVSELGGTIHHKSERPRS